jgi:hypothetical protein
VRICSSDPYATGIDVPHGGAQCICIVGYKWDASTFRCARDCSNDPNSEKFYNYNDITQCVCLYGYTWDEVTGKCIIEPILHYCLPGFYWNEVINLCVRNCTGVLNSNGNYSTINVFICQCDAGFIWDSGLTQCVKECLTDYYSLQVFNRSAPT